MATAASPGSGGPLEAAAARRPATRIAVMPGGSDVRAMYPSAASWEKVLRALAAQHPDAVFCLVGKLRTGDGGTSTRFTRAEVDGLLTAVQRRVDAFDLPLFDQLAIVEVCDVFIAPHTGFGMAALAGVRRGSR